MKTKDNIKSNIHIFFEWVAKLSVLNFCFIFGTALGLGIFGLGPSIRASNYYLKQTLKEEELKVIPTFWRIYAKYFLSSFLISLIYIIAILLLSFSILISYRLIGDPYIKFITIISSSILLIYFFIGFNFVYYFLNEFDISSLGAIKYSFTIPWARFGYMMLIILINIGLIFFLVILDVVLLIFIFSISFLIIEALGNKIFNKTVKAQINEYLRIKKLEEEQIIKELIDEDIKKKQGKQ